MALISNETNGINTIGNDTILKIETTISNFAKVSDDGLAWENVKPVEDLNIILDRVK